MGLVCLTFVWARAIPGWLAALFMVLIMLGVTLITAAYGWARRVRSPLSRTRKTLKEDVEWARGQTTSPKK